MSLEILSPQPSHLPLAPVWASLPPTHTHTHWDPNSCPAHRNNLSARSWKHKDTVPLFKEWVAPVLSPGCKPKLSSMLVPVMGKGWSFLSGSTPHSSTHTPNYQPGTHEKAGWQLLPGESCCVESHSCVPGFAQQCPFGSSLHFDPARIWFMFFSPFYLEEPGGLMMKAVRARK